MKSLWRVTTFLPVLGLVLPVACKSRSNANVQDAVTDALDKTMPGGLVRVLVPKKKVTALIIPPADGSNGAPDTMDGVWWTNARGVHFVVSLKNTVWTPATPSATDPTIGTASIAFVGPQTYATPTRELGGDPRYDAFSDQPIHRNYYGYDIVYSSPTQANLRPASSSITRRERTSVDYNYTMEYTDDGEWTRRTKDRPDYYLRRIINADGTINQKKYRMKIPGTNGGPDIEMYDTAFNGFLADPGLGGGPDGGIAVYIPSVILEPVSGSSVSFNLDPQAPTHYVGIKEGDERMRGTISVESPKDTPVRFFVKPKKGAMMVGDSVNAPAVSGFLGNDVVVAIQPMSANDSNGLVKVTLTTEVIPTLSEQTPLSLNVPPGETDLPVTVHPSFDSAGLYIIRTNAPFPLTLTAKNSNFFDSRDIGPTAVTAPANTSMIVAFDQTQQIALQVSTPAGSPGGNVTMTLEPYSAQPAVRQGSPVAVGGPAVSGTLSGLDGIDVYTISNLSPGAIELSPVLGRTAGIYLTRLDGPASVATQTYGPHARKSSFVRQLQVGKSTGELSFAVSYVGPLNVAQPNLTYSFQLIKDDDRLPVQSE